MHRTTMFEIAKHRSSVRECVDAVVAAGVVLNVLFLSWLYAYYCFDYKWALEGIRLTHRLQFFECNWAYFAGVGAVQTHNTQRVSMLFAVRSLNLLPMQRWQQCGVLATTFLPLPPSHCAGMLAASRQHMRHERASYTRMNSHC